MQPLRQTVDEHTEAILAILVRLVEMDYERFTPIWDMLKEKDIEGLRQSTETLAQHMRPRDK